MKRIEAIILAVLITAVAFVTGFLCGIGSTQRDCATAQQREKLMYSEQGRFTTICAYADIATAYGHQIKTRRAM